MSASESRFALVLELAEEFLERYRQGQRPSLKEYIDRHPELAAEIKEVFPAMALMENVALDEESLAGQAVDDYLTRVSANRLLRVPGMQPLRKELLQSALQYYQDFLKQRGQDATLRKDLASAYLRLATSAAEIDPPAIALSHCEKARQVLEELQNQDPKSNEIRLNLVACHQAAGNLHRRLGQLDAALQSCRQAYRILLEVSPQDPSRTERLVRAVTVHGSNRCISGTRRGV